MTEDLKIIKRLYGEKMAHFCRDTFSTILEERGKLPEILQNNFAPSHSLYADIISQKMTEDFRNHIYDLFFEKDKGIESLDVLTPEELMASAGYKLYECKTEDDIQNFKKYYAEREVLCTFDGERLNSCYVFFALKENASDIKREAFSKPRRQDEYGTSVISIQFSRDKSHTLSIKNRYNHTVNNPDATFGNNLDNIVEGLTYSFEKYYGLKQEHRNVGFVLKGYVRANDGKWYRYNYELYNIYYCSDNIIIDHWEVIRFAKEKYIIMDYFILDLVKKELSLFDIRLKDSFPYLIGRIKKIVVEKNGEEKEIKIINEVDEEFVITIDKNNQIVGLKSKDIKIIGDDFLLNNIALRYLDTPNLQQVGDNFLYCNLALANLYLPKVKEVGKYFLYFNEVLATLEMPLLEQFGFGFLVNNLNRNKLLKYFCNNNSAMRKSLKK